MSRVGILVFCLSLSPLLAADVDKICSNDQMRCRNGPCISLAHKCDGVVHCPDGSDETHALCWNNKCQGDQFRCAYGACVNGTAPCNGVPACADFSDELLPKCRKDKLEAKDEFKCFDGTLIPATNRCDGVRDCADGSDETLWTCAAMYCPSYLFQCAYGACVDKGAACNKVKECADGSDEADALCENFQKPKALLQLSQETKCILPSYPSHGTYTSSSNTKPGDVLDFIVVNVTCTTGYGVNGSSSVYCYKGWWSEQMPQCVSQCHLAAHPSVEYHCQIQGILEVFRLCNEYELTGTVVQPRCRSPNYYSPIDLPDMQCVNGSWSYIAKCKPVCSFISNEVVCRMRNPAPNNKQLVIGGVGGVSVVLGESPWHAGIYTKTSKPYKRICGGSLISEDLIKSECGTITPVGADLIISAGGVAAVLGQVPWQAGIYSKYTIPYKQICGGSLISKDIIISAAHCFWSNVEGKKLPVSNYAAAVGKLYRPWNDKRDEAQRSDVKEIHLPVRFQGSTANYQDDIAVVVVAVQFQYKTFIRPVCVDFNITFDSRQLQSGSYGKVAGWGLTNVTSNVGSPVLNTLELPYVDTDTCIVESPSSFRAFITSDKFCAGFKSANKAVCQGDSGGGLAFLEQYRGVNRYYLRGVVSIAPNPDNMNTCNDNSYTAFTQLVKHEHFIKQFWGFEL